MNCNGESDSCYCKGGDPDDCNIATKTTYDGEPSNCDESNYETEKMVIGVCIPSSSQSLNTSKIVECIAGGTELQNVVFDLDTSCQGESTKNYDEIDIDTCFKIECHSGGNQLAYICAFVIAILKIIILKIIQM
eukprot:UN08075